MQPRSVDRDRQEAESVVGGPGIVGTKTMWKGAGVGAVVGGITGALLAVAFGALTLEPGWTSAAIAAASGGFGGAVGGGVIGGYVLPRHKGQVEDEADI